MSQYFLDFVLGLIIVTKIISDWSIVRHGFVGRREEFLVTFMGRQEFLDVEHVMRTTNRRESLAVVQRGRLCYNLERATISRKKLMCETRRLLQIGGVEVNEVAYLERTVLSMTIILNGHFSLGVQ